MPLQVETQELKKNSYRLRLEVLDMVARGRSGHIGGDFSCMDILVCLYHAVMDTQKIREGSPDRDRFILSKGHSAEALYAVLSSVGIISREELNSYARFGTRLAGHPTKDIPGVEFATGALGHGLPAGVGMAVALKNKGSSAHVYVLMGDGEQAEGSNWEAAMAASKFALGNLTAVIDRNRLQISGNTEDVMPLYDLAAKYRAFGFDAVECDGHNPVELVGALLHRSAGKPVAVIANTVKGCGSPILENKPSCHHLIPDSGQYARIKADLTKRLEEL